MKKRYKIIRNIIIILLVAVTAVVLYFAQAIYGNPVSKLMCRLSAEKYVEEYYPHCYVSRAGYNLKNGNYFANIQCETSPDTNFFVYTGSTGEIYYDSYESYVTSGHNTRNRMMMEYRSLLDKALPQESVDFTQDIFYGDILYSGSYEKYYTEQAGFIPVFMPEEEVILDKEYDYSDISYRYGHVVLYALHEDVSVENACNILLAVKEKLDENSIGFYSIDFVLQKPRQKDGMPNEDDSRVNVAYFLWSDICEEGLQERVRAAHNSLEEYYREEDAKKTPTLPELVVQG